ncbi:ankyrin repeat ph and sec7 domain containing protein secg-related [Anaeramoeba flamelloides]|uniref:Ankyrin repeat ph and sec7 domain containing protein secg-related n=1 Tax=Anaeramoeba flamelloides TaxID=1746091 RepID=A0AAV7Y4X4_9EUKA|nr:ankyrin repeat ph and sec7 domain containing protein secg-related [Anaeramoeba flamelloides]
MSGMALFNHRKKNAAKSFLKKFPGNVNKTNVNDNIIDGKQAINIICEQKTVTVKDIQYLITLGSDLDCKDNSGNTPIQTIMTKDLAQKREIIFCFFKNSSNFDQSRINFTSVFISMSKSENYEQINEFNRYYLIYWFGVQKEILMKKHKGSSENKKKTKKQQQQQKQINCVSFVLDCLNNEEDLIKFKKMLKQNEINLNFKDKKTNLNLLHALIFSNKCDNLESKLQTIKEIVNQNTKAILNSKLSWSKYSELHLISLKPALPQFTNELTAFLISKGSNINTTDLSNATPLFLHLKQANVCNEIVKSYLIHKELNVTIKSRFSQLTQLQLFCKHNCNSLELFKLFLERGARLAPKVYKKKTVLHLVCSNANTSLQLIKFLVKKGSNINEKTSNNLPALFFLCNNPVCKEKFEILSYLLKNGATTNFCSSFRKLSPLHVLSCHPQVPQFLKCFDLLVKNGSSLNVECNRLNTPFHYVMSSNRGLTKEIIRKMLKYGYSLNKANTFHQTPFTMYLTQPNLNPDIINYCLKSGGNIHAKTASKANIVNTLTENYNLRSFDLKIVCKYGAKVGLSPKHRPGNCPLHNVCKYVKDKIPNIKCLLDNGANINQLNLLKETPLLIITQELLKLLK